MTAIKSSNNIIIFGGVFDPVHLGHLHIYQAVKKQISFKKFIILPSKIPVLKNALPIASIKDRLAMLNLMFKNYKDVEISHYEISKTSICKSFTIDSIKHFQQRYLHANFYFVVGADRYMDFKQWKAWRKILTNITLIVINRPYIKVNKNYIKSAYFINMPPINIASSQLRINPDSKYLTKPIISYIAKHFLYAQEQVAAILSTARYQHSLRVAKLAKSLAIDCGYKNLATKAYIAGIYHDVCKELHKNDLIKYVGKYDHKRFVDYHTLHGLAGAKYIHQRFHINDKQILNAIANHVIPAPNPSPLDMIIYCADKLEPARTNSDISNRSKFIALSRKDLKSTFIKLNKEIQEQYN